MCVIAKDSVQDGVRTGHTRTPKVRCQSLEKYEGVAERLLSTAVLMKQQKIARL